MLSAERVGTHHVIRERDVDKAAVVAFQAWRIAEEFGWKQTYDAEYVALARLLDCRLPTC